MPRNILQDVVPPNKRTIRNIPLPEERRKISDMLPSDDDVKYEKYNNGNSGSNDDSGDDNENMNYSKKNNSRGFFPKWGIWLLVFVCVVVLSASFAWVFSGTIVTVTPRTLPITVNVEISASQNPVAGQLSYKILPIVKTKEVVVAADGERQTEKKATGTIVIYNNYSGDSQRLIKNTRFETSKGLIYRIQDSVVVPGKTITGGKTVPGSVEALVIADSSGSNYNVDLSDFTIPGFKSNPGKYAGFYARSKTPMTGGFSGIAKFASDKNINDQRTKLDSDLQAEAMAEALTEVPENFVLYKGAYNTKFESIPLTGADNEQGVTVGEKATLNAYLLNKNDLIKYLATHYINKYDGSPVEINDLLGLVFDLRNRQPQTSQGQDTSILFGLKGEVNAVWLFDQAKLKSDLAGQPKSELDQILKKYPGIVKANAIIRPFWKSNFPSGSIKIILNSDNNIISTVSSTPSSNSSTATTGTNQ